MIRELMSLLKSRKLAPLKPAPITSRPASTDQAAPQPDRVHGHADHEQGERKPKRGVDHQGRRAVSDGPGDAAHRAAEIGGWARARMLGGDRHEEVYVHADS